MMVMVALVGMVLGGAVLAVVVWAGLAVRRVCGAVRDGGWYRAELVCGGRACRRDSAGGAA